MKACAIVTGGYSCDISGVRDYHYIIACDKGLEYCVNYGISADIALGDFDSYCGEIIRSVRTIGYPRDKDDTDTMLAVKHAIDRGYKCIDIFCALGGRMDHTIANIQTVAYATNRGVRCRIMGDNEVINCIKNDTITIPAISGYSLSLLAMSQCTGVTATDVKYPVSELVLDTTSPIGVSNEMLADSTDIKVESGMLLIMQSMK